jgi:outer membrane protein assembly factor BamB
MSRRWLAAAFVMVTGVASAAPLGVVWREPKGCAAPVMAATPDSFLQVVKQNASMSLRDRKTGKVTATIKLPKGIKLQRAAVAGSTLVVWHGKGVLGLDLTGKPRWRRDFAKREVGPQAPIAGTDVVFVHAVKGARIKYVIERLDGASGVSAWKVDAPAGNAEASWVGAGTAHAYVAFDGGFKQQSTTLWAFDLADGHLAWTYQGVPRGTSAAFTIAGDDVVINDFAGAAHIIAGATGKDAPIAIPNLVGVAVHQGRLYTRSTAGDVLAFDLATHKLVWKTSAHGYPSSLDVASPTGVFFVDDAAILRMLDPVTGKLRASYGVAETDLRVHAGSPPLTQCIDDTLVALDPALDTPEETATVTGTFECPGCDGLKGEIRIGDTAGPIDAKGTFSVTVTGRGSLAVQFRQSTDDSWRAPVNASTLRLTGAKTYQLPPVVAPPELDGE